MSEEKTDPRFDQYLDMASSAVNGDPDKMLDELDAIRGFMEEFARNAKDDNDMRAACAYGMIANLAMLVAALSATIHLKTSST